MSIVYRVLPAGQVKPSKTTSNAPPQTAQYPVNPFVLQPRATISQIAKSYGLTTRELLTPYKSPLWSIPQIAAKNFEESIARLSCGNNPRRCAWMPPTPTGNSRLDTQSGTFSWMQASSDVWGHEPQWFDARQGYIPNCHFIASLQALSLTMPHVLRRRMDVTTNKASVRLYTGTRDSIVEIDQTVPCFSPSMRAYSLAVGATSSRGAEDGVVGRVLGWPGIFEKAFAAAGLGVTAMPNYLLASFWVPSAFDNYGQPLLTVPPITALTGQPTDKIRNDFSTASFVQFIRGMCLPNGHAHTPAHFGTIDDATLSEQINLVPSHEYSFCGSIERDGRTYIVLRNAWGNFQPDGGGTLNGVFLGRQLGSGGLFALEASQARAFFGTVTKMGG